MPDIDSTVKMLRRFLDTCPTCRADFMHNVATIADDGRLTEKQAEAILISMNETHKVEHDDVF